MNSKKLHSTPTEKSSNRHKLLPFIFIAEVGLAVFQIGYCIPVFSGVESIFFIVSALASVAAIFFTILYALNIKPKLDIVTIMVCISLAVFLFLFTAAISNFSSIASYRTQLSVVENEDIKATITQNINRNTLIGGVSLCFAVAILPLSVYLPIWYLRRKTTNE